MSSNIEINTDDLESKCDSGIYVLERLYRVLSDRSSENYSWVPIDPYSLKDLIDRFSDLQKKLNDPLFPGQEKLDEFNALVEILTNLLAELRSPDHGRIHEKSDSLDEMNAAGNQLMGWLEEIRSLLKIENQQRPVYVAEDFVSQVRRQISRLSEF